MLEQNPGPLRAAAGRKLNEDEKGQEHVSSYIYIGFVVSNLSLISRVNSLLI